ncbi:2-hydroxyacid dehydrogenase [Marinibaculum pumilum]|uniref:2-hydroxyacid dehydrogenase n=1 Tax=Marinibaculum pumilum TaxID=1766165 RepID=A0ABV7KW38_9PROT
MKPRILVTRRMPPAVTRRTESLFDAALNPEDRLFGTDGVLERAGGRHGLLICPTERLPADAIARLPDEVKIVATYSVGFEHIDIAAAAARGIVVTNTPDVLTDATAEIAMLLMLAAARRATEGSDMVRQDRWRAWALDMLCGVQLSGKRLGILGMGRIGRATAARARAFGMTIHYHNRSELPPDLAQGATFHADVESLLKVSDFLSLHAPATPETRGLLNAERIALLPPGAVVVNTARGDLVDDEALLAALRSGKLFAAGLDVFAGEPNIHPGYRELENVFLLPHLGSATTETREAMGMTALDNLEAFFAGRPVPNPVTPPR